MNTAKAWILCFIIFTISFFIAMAFIFAPEQQVTNETTITYSAFSIPGFQQKIETIKQYPQYHIGLACIAFCAFSGSAFSLYQVSKFMKVTSNEEV